VSEAVPARPGFGRIERFETIGSTNDVVRSWLLDATPELLLAVADEQTQGRGRHGREWTAPPGAALLCSIGFRPSWLEPARTWRLAGTVALAMADAAEDVAGLPVGAVRLKWPNDLVIETGGPKALLVGDLTPEAAAARLAAPLELRKLAGVLGESEGLGTDNPRVVVGIGINADWARDDFPVDLAHSMTSLREASAGRPIDREALLESFLDHLVARIEALRSGFFDVASWTERQATTGRLVTLESGDGSSTEPLLALGVDGSTGALVLADDEVPGGERHVHGGEVVRVRLVPQPAPDGDGGPVPEGAADHAGAPGDEAASVPDPRPDPAPGV
jgi:BirA family transcriptional regulator, biotin operon repressor / biotin---[acetyl-CoA-carboxylase] ligase